MKKLIVGMFVAGLVAMSSLISNQAEAVPLYIDGGTPVGELDTFIACTDLGDSSPAAEEAWVELALGGNIDVTFTEKTEYGDAGGPWTLVDSGNDIYAMDLNTGDFGNPTWYLLKTGNIDGTDCTHFLYDNEISLAYAVIDFSADEFGDEITIDITKISHLSEFGGEPVPEPTTMLLLGSGLVGLMLYGRKRFRKETDKTS